MTHPPETASTVTLIGIPGFWPSGASGEYQINFMKKRMANYKHLSTLKNHAGLKQQALRRVLRSCSSQIFVNKFKDYVFLSC